VGSMQTGRSWNRLPLPNVVAAFLLSAFIVGYVAPAALAVPTGPGDFEVLLGQTAVPVNIGGAVTYTIDVNYDGGVAPDDSVTLTLAVPAGLTVASVNIPSDPGTSSCSAPPVSPVVCTLGAFAAGESAQVTVGVTGTSPGSYNVGATLSGATADPTNANNSAGVTTTVSPANISLTKTANPTSAFAGQDVTFTITATNGGPSDATNVVVSDTLPAGLTFKSATAGCSPAGQTVTCGAVPLPNGNSVIISVVATVQPSATGSLVNTANVASPSDNVPANNTATATVAITAPPAELALTLTDTPDPVAAGANLTYTIAIANAGPNDATNVAVTANVPAETTFVSADNGGTLAGSDITWTIPTIAKDATASLTYVVTVNDDVTAASLSSTASLTYGGDTTASDNTATADTAVGADADLAIVIAVDDLNPGKGGHVTFTIGVGNAGPNDVTGVVVEAKLPKGISFDAATDPSSAIVAPGAYDPSTGRWDPIDLIAGGAATLTLSGTVTTGNQVTVTADAILPAGFSDPTPANATDSVILNQADPGGNGGGNGGGGTGGSGGGTGGTGGTTSEGTAFTGFTATQLMPWLVFFMVLGLSSVEFARRRAHVLPVGSTYGFEPWIT
jgi:large repetitive protein